MGRGQICSPVVATLERELRMSNRLSLLAPLFFAIGAQSRPPAPVIPRNEVTRDLLSIPARGTGACATRARLQMERICFVSAANKSRFLAALGMTTPAAPPRFEVSFTAAAHAAPVTGRLIVVLSKTADPEPRMLVSPLGPPIFAIDLDQLRPAQVAVVDSKAIGYPASLAELPEGDYYAQAVIDVYTQVHRADGHTI